MAEWRDEQLGSLVSFEYGSALRAESRTGHGFNVYGSNGVVGHHDSALVAGPGIIIGRKGSVGALHWSEDDFWPIDTTYWAKPKADLDLRWIREALDLAGLASLDSSTGVPGLNRYDAYERWVPVPPLEEQRRIAEILDTIDETIQATERVITKLWQTRVGAVEHKLNMIDNEYPHRSLLDVVSIPSGQVDPRVEPWASLTLVAPDHIEGGGRGRLLARVSARDQGAISGKYRFEAGDVIYSKIRPELRKAWLTTFSGLCSADMYPLSPRPAVMGEYVASVILGQRFSRFAVSVSARSSGMPKVNRRELAEFRIALAPFEVQQTVARTSESYARRIESESETLRKVKQVRSGLADDLLSGRVRTVAA